MRVQIISMLQRLVNVLGPESAAVHPLVSELLATVLDPGAQQLLPLLLHARLLGSVAVCVGVRGWAWARGLKVNVAGPPPPPPRPCSPLCCWMS